MLASDSQVTLINPSSPLELHSSKKSVINTVLHLHGRPYISISTVDKSVSCTQIKDITTNKLLATIQRRTLSADTIKFEERYDGQKLKIKDWLQEEKTNTTQSSVWHVTNAAGKFIWKSNISSRLALYTEDNDRTPIAWVQPETRTENATLIIENAAQSFVDEVVAVFVEVEHRLRMFSNQIMNSRKCY